MSQTINVRHKANRCDPLSYLVAADQLEDEGGDGTLLRRQGHLLQAVFDLVMPLRPPPLSKDEPPLRRVRSCKANGKRRELSSPCDEFGLYARFCVKTILVSIWPRSLPFDTSVRVQCCLNRACLAQDGKRRHGLDYLVAATMKLLNSLDMRVRTVERLRAEKKAKETPA